jgi:hypothetical protein
MPRHLVFVPKKLDRAEWGAVESIRSSYKIKNEAEREEL